MPERHPLFPSLWGSLWLVLAGFMGEQLTGALVIDLLPGLGESQQMALARLLANALLFGGLLSFKQIGYGHLFHAGRGSVTATLAVTLVPVVALVPALVLAVGQAVQLVERVVPLSAWERQMFSEMAEPSLAMLLMVCVMAPVLEEMLFRGVILRAFLRRYPPGVAIVHSAAVFGLAHLNLYQFVVGLMSGLLLGWLYERTRSLWPCIVLHAAYNSTVTFLPQLEPAAAGGLLVAMWLGAGVAAMAWLGWLLGLPGGRRPG